METFRTFFSFSDPNIVSVVIGSILLTASSAVVGTFTFLKKKALVGDAVAHAVLPGICLAFLLAGNKNLLVLIVGAFVTGWLSLVIMDYITSRSKIKEDTAIALVLSVFFGVGILLLTHIQHSGNAAQTGLQSFLFGKAAALVGTDLIVFGVVALVLILTVALFFKEFMIISFDPVLAISLRLPTTFLRYLLLVLLALTIVVALQVVGIALMLAMLVTPAAAASLLTRRLWPMMGVAAAIGAFSGMAGLYASFYLDIASGPAVVLVATGLFALAFLLAPRRGLVWRLV